MTGMLGHVGIGVESAWGTAVAAANYVEILNESLVTTIERYETKNVIGGLYEPDDSAGVERHEGDIVFAGHPDPLGRFLMAALGANAASSITSTLFSNVITAATTLASSLHPLPPYTVEVYRPGAMDISTSFRYSGVQVGQIELGFAPNQDVRVTASILAKTRASIAKTSPSFPASPTAAFAFDSVSLQLGGAAVARIEALTINIDNQIEGFPTLNNSTGIAKVRRNGPQLIRVGGTIEFDDFTDFDIFAAQTEQQLIVSTFLANSFSLVIDIPRAVFTEFPVQIPGRERLTVDFAMMARYHTGSGSAIQATLVDTTTFA